MMMIVSDVFTVLGVFVPTDAQRLLFCRKALRLFATVVAAIGFFVVPNPVAGLITASGAPATGPDFDPEVAQRFAGVAEWEGFWETTETRSFSRSNAMGHTNNVYEGTGHGHFVLRRSADGWAPAEGDFRWVGEGEASGMRHETMSKWSKSGPRMVGEDWTESDGGQVAMNNVEFTIWMGRRSASMHAGGEPVGAITRTKEGHAVIALSSGDGQHHYEEKTINETTPGTVLTFFIPNYERTKAKQWNVVAGGPGVLAFEHEEAGHDATAGDSIRRSHVVLSPVYDDFECKVEIDGYDAWLPRGNIKAPTQPGSHVLVRATLIPKGKAANDAPKVKLFRFELGEVSREPGVCMNWPRFGADGDTPPRTDPEPDLRFGPEGEPERIHENLTATFKPVANAEGRDSAKAQIDCYDFGGSGELRVICELEDKREIVGILEHDDGRLALIPVPYRRTGSRIAKRWADRVHLSGGDGDDLDDTPVGDGNTGDGFSNYDEYRGFVQLGDHLRTKPGQKDLFVRNKLGSRALPGFFRYADSTQVALHYELRPSEMPASRRMNINRSADSPRTCAADQFQHGLIVDKIVGGDASITDIPGDLWRPEFAPTILILWELFDPGNEEQLASTIAHEMLHATGVRHHGEADDYVAWLRKERDVNGRVETWFEERPARYDEDIQNFVFPSTPGKRIRIFSGDENEVVASPNGFLDTPRILFLGHYWQQHSGDVNCVMRYHCAEAFVLPFRPRDRFVSPGEPFGTGLCASSKGTQFNVTDESGKPVARYSIASRGDCAHSFCVRDDAPDRTPSP